MPARVFFEHAPDLGRVIVLMWQDDMHTITAKIAPQFGSNLYHYQIDEHQLIHCDIPGLVARATIGTSAYTGTPILFPHVNRIRLHGKDRRWRFEGKTYSLESVLSPSGNAPLVHGIVRDERFDASIVDVLNDRAIAETCVHITPASRYFSGFPFPCILTLRWEMTSHGLHITWKVTNTGDMILPFTFAMHAEFVTGIHEVHIRVPARGVMEMDEDLLPTGNILRFDGKKNYLLDLNTEHPVSVLQLDHAYTDLSRTYAPTIQYKDLGLRITIESGGNAFVVYTGNKDESVCLEPQWGKTNAHNLAAEGYPYAVHGLQYVAPGYTAKENILLRVSWK